MFCKTCGNYQYSKSHKCPPRFWVAHEEYLGEDLEIVFAHDYQWAAERYAEQYEQNSCEYNISGKGEELTIQVFDNPRRENGKTFIVTGEMIPTYYAKEEQ